MVHWSLRGPADQYTIPEENQLSGELISLLRKSGAVTPSKGQTLQEKLAENFSSPENCPLLGPPKLNPLIQKFLTEATTR